MFRRKFLLIYLCIIIIGVFLMLNLVHVRQIDRERYDSLVASSVSSRRGVESGYISSQIREGISKNFWFTSKNGDVLRFAIKYNDSEIVISFDGGQSKMVENMCNITVVMQEELYYIASDGRIVVKDEYGSLHIKDNNSELVDYNECGCSPYQRIRYIEGDSAVYDYKQKTFYIEDAKFKIFNIEGHEFSEDFGDYNADIVGYARKIALNTGQGKIDFNAEHVKFEVFNAGYAL